MRAQLHILNSDAVLVITRKKTITSYCKIYFHCPTPFIDVCSLVFICLTCMDGDYMFCVLFQMNLLLKEYLTSGDVLEAEHCLRDLEVPHFHHELVYEVKQEKVRCTVQNKCCSNVQSPQYERKIFSSLFLRCIFPLSQKKQWQV